MRSRKPKAVIAPKCDWCGEHSETFVVTAKHMTFCRVQTVGQPPEKDCMEDYIRSKKNVRNEQLWQEKANEEKKEISKKEKEKVLKKLDDYLFELKQKQRRQRATKYQAKTYSESKSTI